LPSSLLQLFRGFQDKRAEKMAGGCATDFYEGCRSNASLRRLRFLLLSIPQGCRWKNVAQISNLRYRRFVIGRTLLAGGRWQVENLRYSAARRGLSQRRSGTGVSPASRPCVSNVTGEPETHGRDSRATAFRRRSITTRPCFGRRVISGSRFTSVRRFITANYGYTAWKIEPIF
jgi:hypothetical protein